MAPGGWIEQLEVGPFIASDDNSLPADSALAAWGPYMKQCGDLAGRPCDILLTMSESIQNAGFVDVHEKVYKWPIGPWPRDQKFKEAGVVNCQHWMSGMEGWCMWLLTKYGQPEPWTKDQVYVYCAKLRAELKNPYYHAYHRAYVSCYRASTARLTVTLGEESGLASRCPVKSILGHRNPPPALQLQSLEVSSDKVNAWFGS